ncbi:MAG: hypothetical protein IPH28_14060 [Cytophagaceae bacterium]|nr:hypothetical protein [Cytophagaceae bacterium]
MEEVRWKYFYSAQLTERINYQFPDSVKQPIVSFFATIGSLERRYVHTLKPIDVRLTFNKDGKPAISWNVTQENCRK